MGDMTAVVKYLFVLISGFVTPPHGCALSVESKFTRLDLDVVGNITEYFNTKTVVFVEDSEDVGLMNTIKVISGRFVYHAVVNRKFLQGIIEKNITQWNYFHRRTAIVTKEELKLSLLLSKVLIPHFLTWIVFRDYTLFPSLNIPVSNQVIFINSTSGRTSAERVYHLKPETTATIKPFLLKPSPDEKLRFGVKLEKINFEKVAMKMLILNQKNKCLDMNKTLDKLECFQQELLELMALRLNFSINVIECIEKEYPFVYPNGSLSELFLRLKHGEVDFSAISHVILLSGNFTFMEFVWPTFLLKTMMYLKQGRPAGRWKTYLRPLENSVWWGILVCIIATGILLQIFEKLLTNGLKFNYLFALDLVNSTLRSLQVFCNQALADIPSSYSIRIIYFLKLFIVLIFFQAYCAYLVSSITITLPYFPFKDLKGFFENQQYRIMTLRRGFNHFYFRRVIGAEQKENFMLPKEELPHTIQDALDKLCRENYLTFSDFKQDVLNFQRLTCRISELPTPAAYLYTGIAMPQNSPLKEFLKRELLYLRATGIIKRITNNIPSHTGFHDKYSQNEFKMVSMAQIFSIFIFLGFGIALSIVILILELILDKCRSSRDLNNKLRKFGSNARKSFRISINTPLTSTKVQRNTVFV